MKILHTSDWHIGHRLYNKEREEEFNLFFNWLIEQINQNKIDLLLISGDIFDIAYPSNYALKLYYKTLYRLKNTSLKKIIITGGNHDSISTLNAPKDLLEVLDVSIIGGVSETINDEIIEIKNQDNKTELVICAVPFLRDKDIRKSTAGETYQERQKNLKDGIINHYKELADKTRHFKEQNIPVIAMGHLFMAGSQTTDSERDIHIGNLGMVHASQFPDVFDYVALGHIHKPQIIGGNQFIRYSGSPLPLSFSEKTDKKQLILIETENKNFTLKIIEVPTFRKLIYFNGTLNQVLNQINSYRSESDLAAWAEVTIQEPQYDISIQNNFEKFIENIDTIEILKYKILFDDQKQTLDKLYEEGTALKDLKEIDVFNKLIDEKQVANPELLQNTFAELLDNVYNDEDN